METLDDILCFLVNTPYLLTSALLWLAHSASSESWGSSAHWTTSTSAHVPLHWHLSLPHTVLNTPLGFMPTTSSWPPGLNGAILCEQSQAFWKHSCYCKTSTNGSCGGMQSWEAAVTAAKGVEMMVAAAEAAMTGWENGGCGHGSHCNEWPQGGSHWVNPTEADLCWSFLSPKAHSACVSGKKEAARKLKSQPPKWPWTKCLMGVSV